MINNILKIINYKIVYYVRLCFGKLDSYLLGKLFFQIMYNRDFKRLLVLSNPIISNTK